MSPRPPPTARPVGSGQAEVGKSVTPADMPPDKARRRARGVPIPAPTHGGPISDAEIERLKAEANSDGAPESSAGKITGQTDPAAPPRR